MILLITCAFLFLLPACAPQKTLVKNPSVSIGSSLISDTLYFGTDTSQGPVTPDQWSSFLSSVVTPRFPDGLTVWDAKGQWRGKSGKIGKEKTKVLLLIHPDSPEADQAIQEIIDAYKKEFEQESVMKVRTLADVSF
ncbi:MAG TPA: DUF3574 domain-containing protein [bacterium]|nr:DUF3574 domain-containing protein [bacterium]